MKTEKNILIAFILNLAFSVFEFIGGVFTGSVAIISDAIHDIGDATSIGVAFFLEKKSKKQPDRSRRRLTRFLMHRWNRFGRMFSSISAMPCQAVRSCITVWCIPSG